MPAASAAPPAAFSELRSTLRELQDEAILLRLPAPCLAGIAQFAVAGGLPEASQGIVPILATVAVASVVWAFAGGITWPRPGRR